MNSDQWADFFKVVVVAKHIFTVVLLNDEKVFSSFLLGHPLILRQPLHSLQIFSHIVKYYCLLQCGLVITKVGHLV